MSSTRLPGKIMLNLHGKTVLQHVIERVSASMHIDKVVVATTDFSVDDTIIEECERLGIDTFRGSSEDVLSRYYGCARQYGADTVIRITSDCPVIDPILLDAMVEYFHSNDFDYVSNTIERTFPRGLDAEIFTFKALEKAFNEATEPFEKEHVTPYIHLSHPEKFSLGSYTNNQNNSQYRLTLDTQDDWTLIKKIYDSLYHKGEIFSYDQVITLLKEQPDLANINAHIEQKKINNA